MPDHVPKHPIRSSAAEYLAFAAATGNGAECMEMRYEDRLTVRLAYASDYSYDAKALQAAIDYLGPEERSVVDLTFEDGPHLYQEQGEG